MELKNLGKSIVSGVAAVGAGAGAAVGTFCAASIAAPGVKYLVSPDPVQVNQKGKFLFWKTKKSRLVKVNPYTGKVKDYTGSRKPGRTISIRKNDPDKMIRLDMENAYFSK